ncbi:MAG TPA: two-component regulator propeller domain-containing protein, partial [Mucilaginibacter sp.]
MTRQSRHPYLIIAYLACICLFVQCPGVYAQKHTFWHYDIEDGLIQSQVVSLSTDQQHRLWMGTFGGACRFDGKEFIGYTRQNGLPNNYVGKVFTDKQNRTWFGTLNGLAMLQNNKIVTFKPPVPQKRNVVSYIVQDGEGTIWAIMSGYLFRVKSNALQRVTITDSASLVTSIAVNAHGSLFAAVY